MTDLTDLVQQLACTHDSPVTRFGHVIRYRRQDALLDILAAAVSSTSATTGNGGRGGDIQPRLGFDATSSELYTAIRRRLTGWAIAAGVPCGPYFADGSPLDWTDAAQLLLAWHSALPDAIPAIWTGPLTGWITAITDLVVDPPRRLTLDATCPACQQRWAYTGPTNDPERVDALQVLIRDPATASETICRNCGAHWAGLDGAEHLADQLRQRAAS